jgi:hypothetical protein
LKIKLHNLADVQSGYQFRGRVEPHPQGDISVIQVKDLRDDVVLHTDGLIKVKLDKDPAAYLVQEGDVLFLSRGHRLFATAITKPLHRAIVPGYFFIIRLRDSGVLPEYVAWYINQPPAQNRLKPSHAGTHMPIVPKSAFDELEIDVPPLNIQRAIVALDQLSRKERHLCAELEQIRRQMIETVCLRAISDQSKGINS